MHTKLFRVANREKRKLNEAVFTISNGAILQKCNFLNSCKPLKKKLHQL